jgi:glycosyltransferase involved in cell wall biosynthesis
MNKISAIVITKDEEKNISDCLSSVQWANEIIVVDAESEDKTVELAKQFTDKIFIRKWEGYVPQKKFALSLTSNEWVLSVDADERITPELKNEIQNITSNDYTGYKIRRKNFLFSKEITSCGWGNDYQLRFFRKDKTDLTDRLVHEGFTVDGRIGKLENPMLHYTFSSFTDYFSKINYYTSLKAQELYNKKRRVNGWTIFSHTVSAFFLFFITKRGFKDGVYGLIISLLHSVSTMLNYIKLWELQIKNPR